MPLTAPVLVLAFFDSEDLRLNDHVPCVSFRPIANTAHMMNDGG